MERLAILLAVGLLTLLVEAKGAFSPSEAVWYAQPAVVTDMSVPWAKGETASGNYAPNPLALQCPDPWEAESLPIGNGRVGGTCFGGDRRDRINLNEVSLWIGGPNLPGNGSGYSYGPLTGSNNFGSYQPFGNLVAPSFRSRMTSSAMSRASISPASFRSRSRLRRVMTSISPPGARICSSCAVL